MVSGDPTGYLSVVALADGDLLVGAYDLGLKDVTVRRIDPATQEVGELVWLEGFPDVAGPLTGDERGAFGPGVDMGSELDMAVDREGNVALVYRDSDTPALRMLVGDGSSWHAAFDLDEAGRWPDVEPDALGGWVVAYQLLRAAPGTDGLFETTLRVAQTISPQPASEAEFDFHSLESGDASIVYPELPAGQGATPSLASVDSRWFLVWHNAIEGSMQMATWTQLPGVDVVTVLEPSSRGDYPGGRTGLAPKLVARPPDHLDALYMDATTGELRHARWRWDGGVTDLAVQTVDSGNNGTPQREIGLDYSLVTAPDGRLIAAWQDATFGDLLLGRAAGQPADWDTWTWSTEGGTGFFPTVVYSDADLPPLLIYGRWTFPEIRTIHQELVVQTFQDRR